MSDGYIIVTMNTPLKVDLHCHSLFSDGTLSPKALLEKAVDAGIHLLALTDHDTISGVPSLCEAAAHQPIRIITGVELSVRWKMHDLHVIGLNIDITSPEFLTLLAQQNEQRTERAKKISISLETLGVQQAYQKACCLAGHERIARPHFAQVLVNEGIVPDIKAAFKRYLTRGRIGYVSTMWLCLDEAVSGILMSGGQAVIAHPLKYKLTRSKLHALIKDFKALGGAGMEVVSGDMQASEIGELAGLCCRFDLFASSGSDYHGDGHSRINLGGQQSLPLTCKPIWEQWDL